MLAVGRALMAKPKLIMMDEPSLGLAPIVVRGIFEIIREINRQGITVLLIEQNANMALKIADWPTSCRPGPFSCRVPAKNWPPTRRSKPHISEPQSNTPPVVRMPRTAGIFLTSAADGA